MNQATTAEVSLEGMSTVGRWVRGLRAFRKLVKNPGDTELALLGGLYLNVGIFPAVYARFQADPEGQRLLEERPSIDSRSVDLAALGALPAGTLGREYARFLADGGLSPDVFQAPGQVRNRDAAYLAKRIRQSHDLWHVLTGYKTDLPGEIELQAFTYGQLGAPSSLLIALFGPLRHRKMTPGLWRRSLEAYRIGKRSRFLATFPWERHWATPVEELRAQLLPKSPEKAEQSPLPS